MVALIKFICLGLSSREMDIKLAGVEVFLLHCS